MRKPESHWILGTVSQQGYGSWTGGANDFATNLPPIYHVIQSLFIHVIQSAHENSSHKKKKKKKKGSFACKGNKGILHPSISSLISSPPCLLQRQRRSAAPTGGTARRRSSLSSRRDANTPYVSPPFFILFLHSSNPSCQHFMHHQRKTNIKSA